MSVRAIVFVAVVVGVALGLFAALVVGLSPAASAAIGAGEVAVVAGALAVGRRIRRAPRPSPLFVAAVANGGAGAAGLYLADSALARILAAGMLALAVVSVALHVYTRRQLAR